MILLPVSEAEALDYYTILLVKHRQGMDVGDRLKEIERVVTPLIPIVSATDLANLYHVNLEMFFAIESAMSDKITASEVQRINHRRFQLKQRIQSVYWPNSPLQEVKSGVC